MKRWTVIWSEDAKNDLLTIATYIADDNLVAALKTIDKIEETGNNLGKMAVGHRGRMGNIFEIGIPRLPYIIAYALGPRPNDGEALVILRVIHAARDWTADKWPG